MPIFYEEPRDYILFIILEILEVVFQFFFILPSKFGVDKNFGAWWRNKGGFGAILLNKKSKP